MKKTIIICASFTVFAFICCLVYGLNFLPVPETLANASTGSYSFLSTMRFFLRFFPTFVATGYTIGLAVAFGSDQEGSLSRFSSAMFRRFKNIMIFCLVSIFLFTLGTEVFIPSINSSLHSLSQKPALSQEYFRVAQRLYEKGDFDLSYIYAKNAYEANSEDKDAYNLMINAELMAKDKKAKSVITPEASTLSKIKENRKFQERISAVQPFDVLKLLETARECMKNQDWFGAHYNASKALEIASSRDINVSELKEICAEAWNNLTSSEQDLNPEQRQIYRTKLEGYTALINGDNLKAYYIFKGLSVSSPELSIDADVVNYLARAKALVEKTCFFMDETYNLQGFESANDIHFTIQQKDGTRLVIFVKGVTPVVSGTAVVQYLRDLTVFQLDSDGNAVSALFDSYAKMVSIDTSFFDSSSLELMGLDPELEVVPLIMLKSVDRRNEGVMNVPVAVSGIENIYQNDLIILPVDYGDFELIQDASRGPEAMAMMQLFKFMGSAEKYGYSTEVFAQTLLDRLLYPLFTLVIMILLASFAWYCRLEDGETFKFKWIVMFPFLGIVFYIIYRLSLVLYKLINFALLGIAGFGLSIVLGVLVQVILIFMVSVLFCGCKNSSSIKAEDD